MNGNAAKKTLLSEALDEKQYQELNHDIILRNDTSGVSFFDYQSININELRDDSICISLPKNICQKGHNLTLAIFVDALKKKITKFPSPDSKKSISIIGKVIDFTEDEDKNILIEVKFTQYNPYEWQSIMNIYFEQQRKISSFINEVKK